MYVSGRHGLSQRLHSALPKVDLVSAVTSLVAWPRGRTRLHSKPGDVRLQQMAQASMIFRFCGREYDVGLQEVFFDTLHSISAALGAEDGRRKIPLDGCGHTCAQDH